MPHPITQQVTKEDIVEMAQELGLTIVYSPIKVGDLYLAGRNTGIHLLTCAKVNDRMWIVPKEKYAYPYNTWECYKVIDNS